MTADELNKIWMAQASDHLQILADAAKWRNLMVELRREIKPGQPIDETLVHIIKTCAERIDGTTL